MIAVTRELTKLHEDVVRGALGDIDVGEPRGEYVLVLAGAPDPETGADDTEVRRRLAAELAGGASTRDAATAVAAAVGRPRRDVYALAVGLARAEAGPRHADEGGDG